MGSTPPPPPPPSSLAHPITTVDVFFENIFAPFAVFMLITEENNSNQQYLMKGLISFLRSFRETYTVFFKSNPNRFDF